MRRLSVGLCLLVLSAPVTAQSLADADVNTAIVLGKANTFSATVFHCTAGKDKSGFYAGGIYREAIEAAAHKNRNYEVFLFPARGWISQQAWTATLAGKPFSAADVSADWRESKLRVVVYPQMPDADDDAFIPAAIKNLNFRTKLEVRDIVVNLATPFVFEHRTWKNAKGATVDYQYGIATIDAGSLINANSQLATRLTLSTEDGDKICEIQKGRIDKLLKSKK